MLGTLRRLASTGAAYTASSVLAKVVAVALLPVYTRFLTPADYGAAEVLLVMVIASSIVLRVGMIEALLRFYHRADADRDAVVRTAFASLLWTTVAGSLVLALAAEPVAALVLGSEDAGLVRIAVFGLLVFTVYELLLALYRLDERAREYFLVTGLNVVLTIGLTVALVVGAERGAEGLLLGNFGASAVVLVGLLAVHRRRLALVPDLAVLRRLVRFGGPTVPAELSLYALNFIDRVMLARLAGLAEAGLYALAVKFAQVLTVLVRGFQLAWPPLAYGIRDDREASVTYGLVVTWFVALCAFAVTGLALLSRWLVRLLAAPEFFEAWKAVPLVATGVSLYAVQLVLLVAVGRTGRTEANVPVIAVATASNVGLNALLIPPLGIVGAGIALIASYLVMLVGLVLVTRRLFPVALQWIRLAAAVGFAGALVVIGELLAGDEGVVAFAIRSGLWLTYPALLAISGFLTPEERAAVAGIPPRVRAWRDSRDAPGSPATDQAPLPAPYEAEVRDEDEAAGS
ncbi:MAG: lipopolysaccharide biosynthesis protein [Solirubrobacterales bacterium]